MQEKSQDNYLYVHGKLACLYSCYGTLKGKFYGIFLGNVKCLFQQPHLTYISLLSIYQSLENICFISNTNF